MLSTPGFKDFKKYSLIKNKKLKKEAITVSPNLYTSLLIPIFTTLYFTHIL